MSSPPNSYNGEDSDSEPPSINLCIDHDKHPTVWDPEDGEIYVVKGRIVVDLPLPRQRLVSVTLHVDYHVPPGGTGEAEIYPKIHTTIQEASGTVRVSSSEMEEPRWILELKNLRRPDILRQYSASESRSHMVLFKVFVPVGTHFFKDKGSGSVTRWFNLRFTAKSECDNGRKEDWGEEVFSVTTMSTRKATAVQQPR